MKKSPYIVRAFFHDAAHFITVRFTAHGKSKGSEAVLFPRICGRPRELSATELKIWPP